MRAIVLLASMVGLVACGEEGVGDAGTRDASAVDAGADAGARDAGTRDASAVDAAIDAGADAATDAGRPCVDGSVCPFGERCVAGACTPTECTPGSRSGGVPARECGDGQICDLFLSSEGEGRCVAYAPECAFDGDCAFGFRCAGACVRSECHAGTEADLGDYAPRPCASGICEFGDGADLNGGRGMCVPP